MADQWCDKEATSKEKECSKQDVEYITYLISDKAKADEIMKTVEGYYDVRYVRGKIHWI